MAIREACNITKGVMNTGKQCDTAMGPSAMFFAVPPKLKLTQSQLDNALATFTELINEVPSKRIYPLFGQTAPIRTIDNNQEEDVVVTLDDGSKIFVSYGVYNRVFDTEKGGLCYGKALMSFNRSGFSIIEIDKEGQVLMHKNADGTFSGYIPDSIFSPAPKLGDFKNPYFNRFQISISPLEIINNCKIFDGGSELLSLVGLLETNVIATSVNGNIVVRVETECAGEDLVETLGIKLADEGLYTVVNSVTKEEVTITGATLNGDNTVTLEGDFTPGVKYLVSGTGTDVWFIAGIEGYDAKRYQSEVLIVDVAP